MKIAILLTIFSLCLLPFPAATQQGKTKSKKIVKKTKRAKIQYGTASYYSSNFNGQKTANGELFSQNKLTAAHNNVPLGTWVKVTNLKNKKAVTVRVTDRLHKRNRRLIDLSKAAARRIGIVNAGTTPVRVEVIGKTRPVARH